MGLARWTVREDDERYLDSRVKEVCNLHQYAFEKTKARNRAVCVRSVVGGGAAERMAVATRTQRSDFHGRTALRIQDAGSFI